MGTRRAPGGLWVGRRTGDGGTPPPPPPWSLQRAEPFASTRYTLYVADLSGRPIGELWGTLESCTWGADGYGTATLLAAPSVVRDQPWLLEFGNRVMIEFENGLEPWGGVIDVPRETTAATVRVQMYQAGYMLGWRLLDEHRTFSGATASTAANILRTTVAGVDDLGVEAWWPGAGDADGPLLDVAFDARETVAAVASRLRELDPHMHWLVEPRRDNGRITFNLVTYRDYRRDDADRVVLSVGHNFVSTATLQQGPIFNAVRVDLPDVDEPVTASDSASIGRFGRRQEPVTLPNASETETPGRAWQHASGRVQAMAWPRLRTNGAALDLPPARYRDYGVGSRVRVEGEAPHVFFQPVTIVSISYAPGGGTLSLVFDDSDRTE